MPPRPPALGSGVFSDALSDPSAGGGGGAFATSAPERAALVTERQGVFTSVALDGDPAPGGGTFAGFLWADPAMNANGDVAFIASTFAPSSSGVFFAEQSAPGVPLLPGVAVPGIVGLVLAGSLGARARRSLRCRTAPSVR